jgi:hypothetical protein
MRGRDAPARYIGRIVLRSVLVFADFVTDDAADDGAADGSDRAATRKNRASDGTGTGADGGVLVLIRHAGATGEAEFMGLPLSEEDSISELPCGANTVYDLPKSAFARSRQ